MGEITIDEHVRRFVGSAAICRPEAAVAQFQWFLLEPEVRGRGLGDRLMRGTIEHARVVGVHQRYDLAVG